ncbi:MAG TPA: tetratricopeptide repeat protein, partial [Gammaproteobacteria bacterium]
MTADPAVRMQRAVAAHQRGALAEAEQDYRAVLAMVPRHADATHFLGLLLHQRGDAAGFPLLQQSLQLAPDNYQFRGNLAGVLMQLGRGIEAERLYREALALNPDYLGGHLNLGILYAMQGDHPRALAEFDAALRLDRGSFAAWFNRAESLQQLARRDESLQSCRHAAAAAKHDPDLQLQVASALREAGEIEAARRCHERALELVPASPVAESSLGNLMGMQGDLAAAESHYRRALALNPDYAGAYYNLTDLKQLTPEDPAWDGLIQLSGRIGTLAPDEAVPLHFALGRVWDGRRDYPQAFAHLVAGNRLKRAGIRYDEPRQARFFQEFAAVFGADFIGARRLDSADPRPVFIVGMPRSGTTLVEQILASHPQVHGAGETHALRNSLREELPPDDGDYRLPGQLAELEAGGFHRAAARYSRYLESLSPSAARITNKLPGNMVFVGLVSLLYPQA